MDNGDLIARSRAIIGSDAPVDLDAIVELKMKVFEQIGFGHALGVARTVPDDYECGLGEDAKPVDPASKENFLINELTEGMNQRALVERGFHSRKSFILRSLAGTTKLTAAVPSSFRQMRLSIAPGTTDRLRRRHPASDKAALDSRCLVALRLSLIMPADASFRFERASQRGLSSSMSSFLSTRTDTIKSNSSPQDFRLIESWLIISADLFSSAFPLLCLQ